MKALQKPIVILGAARSGTTLLVRILRKHPDVACWNEPSFVWRYGHAFRRSDVIRKEEATPKIKAYIRGRFQAFLDQSPGTRFMEKTPGNCFRVPFVMEVLPDARVVHIVRDGRNVAFSAADMWMGGGLKKKETRTAAQRASGVSKTFGKKMRLSQRKVTDWGSFLAFAEKAGRTSEYFRRELLHDSRLVWGPLFPGLKDVRRTYSLLETCAVQWDLCVRVARSAGLQLPEEQYLEVRYEDLLADPAGYIARMLTFLELPYDDERLAELTAAVGTRTSHAELSSWRSMLTADQVRGVEDLVGSTLVDLGYPLARELEAPVQQALASSA